MMEQRMNFETFREPLGGWADKMRPFIEGEDMWQLYQKIKKDAQTERIVPNSTDTFRAFKACSPENLRVLFYLQDPYPRIYKGNIPQATGIAMDCRYTPDGKKLQPSLELWYDAIDRYINSSSYKPVEGYLRMDDPRRCERSPNLDYLHEQGVMLLNTDLTCKKDKTSSHKGYWEKFQQYLLGEILSYQTGIVYVLCGTSSHALERYISPLGNYIFKLEHPFAAGHRGDDIWRDNEIFAKINKIMVENNGKHYNIFWDKKDWDIYKDPPF